MKKTSLLVLALVALVFITQQSFFSRSRGKVVSTTTRYFKAYPTTISMCQPLYNQGDSAKDIPALTGWGHYQWKISNANDSAQYFFNQGISLYYAFHTIESIASFTKATHLAPDCAMAWYGKALAMGPTINYENGYRPPSGALQAAIKSKELSANCTPFEKDLITAMQVRYSADTAITVKSLRIKYAEAMNGVYEKHQQNADAVTLYADGLLLIHPWDLYDHSFNAKAWTPEIRALLEHAIAISPKHPGANHYYIHTMEASGTPEVALASAHLMDTLMPGIAHFTHMPSHIYIRTGDFIRGIKVNDDAVASFETAVKAYRPIMNGLGLYKFHNIHLKANCALMAGNYKIAIAAADEIKSNIPDFYLAFKNVDGIYFQYAYSTPILAMVRFGKWDEILKMPAADTLPYASVLRHFARGMAFARKQDVPKANAELKLLQDKMTNPQLKLIPDNFSSAYNSSKVAEALLKGAIAEQQKNYPAAIVAFKNAVIAEDDLIYNEPRDWPIPARQFLGDALNKIGQYDKAIAVFNKDLTINPNNGWTLTGLCAAYKAKGNTIALKQTEQKLNGAFKIKDVVIANAVF